MAASDELLVGIYDQGTLEKLTYSVRIKDATTISSITSTKIYDEGGTDKSSTNLSGASAISSKTITTATVQVLNASERYRLVVVAVLDGQTQAFVWILDGVEEKSISD